ncbi:hypothetical protein AK812_SmicGene24924 [Symbiodinium microadriaticum]|uniref:Uncharacterized protein n=1 Tax=Symbiodinium microadriaticum TaxID=2951 RepID=A0A1Q9DDG1_SYMMI|nr:hypothetical protein AK812_SmicGene24924 [Symbiodinium microadriaticum]
MPAWHSKQYGRGNAGSYQSSSSHQSWQSGKGYGKGGHYGKGFGNPYRASPYQHGRQGGLEQAIQGSFQAALQSTLEGAITEGFALLTNKFTSADGAEKPPPTAPSARVGSKLTRAIVGLFGSSQEKEATVPSEPPTSPAPSEATDVALKAMLEQQSQTMQMMMSLVQSSMKATHDDKPTATEALKADETNNGESTAKDALILQLQQEIENLKKQTGRRMGGFSTDFLLYMISLSLQLSAWTFSCKVES